ncbi:MAG: DUF1573 domain-containing protein [Bacteroidota bacterium]
MKKIALFTFAMAITAGVMAQAQAKKNTEAQKAKVTAPVKSQVVQAVPAQAPAAADQTSPNDVMKINTEKHDFGKIKQGTPVSYSFELKNTSNKPLVVENSYASCGCTTPEKIVEPILPGATAKLKVQYNAANPGVFNKDVHIKLAGISQEKVVYLTGEVVPAASAEIKQ